MSDLGDLERTKRGSIIGRIWFAVGDDAFPDSRWADFIVVVLGWWIGQLVDLRMGRRGHVEFLFMDGPFSVLAEPTKAEALAISFHTDRDPVPRMPPAISARRYDVETELLTTARKVVDACWRKKWHDDVEVQKLARLVDELANTLQGDQVSLRPPPPSREEVENRLLDLIGGDLSREEAANWARVWVVADGPEIETQIWEALRRLLGADSPSTDRPYLYQQIDFEAWLTDLRRRA